MNAVAEKFEQFEWLTHGITAKSPIFGQESHSTGEKPLDYQDRLGAIASMDTQLEKSVTSLIIYGEMAKSDYEYIRNHLAKIMMNGAVQDKKREPEHIAIYHLSWLVARMVIDFSMNPELEDNFTPQGRLYYAGVKTHQMAVNAYRQTWKSYENMMVIALETSIKSASSAVEKYRKNTYKEAKI
ncbi:hypothetical protein [Acinetobacter silvestris]|uniref:Uncharacterized protein n=1 Tax=Acinetobacter silvestris TaxID=1977882 RepID=A0A1Y3CGS6_9GAMM|nr:hypothetical protein [Acinetobacter silvestris]OTG65822.1 hypothetical protein B9T28_06375 [Acinetobacter silvestris]